MINKVIVITGASDGIGAIAARELSNKGATVVVIGRSPEKTRFVADGIDANYYYADFSCLSEVRVLAANLKATYPRIDILINNAGGIFGDRELTIDGNEKTLQVNHLAPFLLTNLLMEVLLESNATVINVSSVANRLYGKLDSTNFNLTTGYSPNKAYGNAKLANILFTKELHRRYYSQGLSSIAVHPGNISTNFARDTTSSLRFLYRTFVRYVVLQPPEKGADPLVWLASSRSGRDWQPGTYYNKHKRGKENKQASDMILARQLWTYSEDCTRYP